ncbi:hypothetical protein [Caproicibacter sp.]|uniref:hypothetical protein n=1 Tax=Caproicibacter sp. TaxID=2814884 RepID=UPI003989806B
MDRIFTNLTWKNHSGKVGDNDGPAYVVYSNRGYYKASEAVAVSGIQQNLVRRSDGKTVNAYLFLGIDIYDGATGEWMNCADAGLAFRGSDGGFHAFVNRFMVEDGEKSWWESQEELDRTHDFEIVLDTSEKANWLKLTIIDITAGNKTVDSKSFPMKGTLPDGSNTAYYQDYAIDFPDDVCDDKREHDFRDWDHVMAYNENENLYLKNIRISEATLYGPCGSRPWTEECTEERFLWPDRTRKINYVCTTVYNVQKDRELIIELDMNR